MTYPYLKIYRSLLSRNDPSPLKQNEPEPKVEKTEPVASELPAKKTDSKNTIEKVVIEIDEFKR